MTAMVSEAGLRAGALVWADLTPTKGHEQEGVRPVVVLTVASSHQRNATAIVCPVTRNTRPWPTKILLPDGLPITGAVLADQIRCIDRAARGLRQIGLVPETILAEIRHKVAVLIGAAPGYASPGTEP